MLGELVELVHIDVHEELRCEIAERQTLSRFCRLETFHNAVYERQDALVLNVKS